MAPLSELSSRFSGRLLRSDDEVAPFLTDWRKLWHGKALAVAQPDTPEDVAAVVRWCVEEGVPIVPQGGNTGLSGGATPDASGRALLLSLVRLNRIRAVDTLNNTITVDAGCILHAVQQAADEAERLFPLSLAAEGSCTIGGNLASNAGGTAVLRYGNARDLCLGIEVATAQGQLWDGLRGLRKDNSGYDLRDLYIGSEGTLGIITGAVLKLFPKPAGRVAAFVAVPSPAAALDLLDRARACFDTALTAFEFLSQQCLSLVLDHFPALRRPVDHVAAWYVLVELTDLIDEQRARVGLEQLLGAAFDTGIVSDAAIADSVAQTRSFWALRENITEAQGAAGKTIKHDVAVPLSQIASFLAAAESTIRTRWPDLRFVTFGHLGDGNIHYNFSPARGGDQVEFLRRQETINRIVHDEVAAHGGSISAEHGLGVLRRDEAARYKSPVELGLLRSIKRALDPLGIMNPGKVLA